MRPRLQQHWQRTAPSSLRPSLSSSPHALPFHRPVASASIDTGSYPAAPHTPSPASAPLPFFFPSFCPAPRTKEDVQFISALTALYVSPCIRNARIFQHDAAVFNLASSSRPNSFSTPSQAVRDVGVDLSESSQGKQPEPELESEGPEGDISDQEWEIRTGRAIYILQETLPTFFSTGLVSSLDVPEPRIRSIHSSPSLTESLLSTFTDKGKAKASEDLQKSKQNQADSIYSPRVRLEYKPPVALPPPLPRTLRVEGLHLYIASSVFVRHTLNALYTDLRVDIRRARVHGPPKSDPSSSSSTAGSSEFKPSKGKYRRIREKSFFIGLAVTGTGRVSGAPAEWEVNYTYSFSPITGLIHLHTIDSIEPAPHAALFEAMGRFGLVGGGSERSPGSGMTPTGCKGRGS